MEGELEMPVSRTLYRQSSIEMRVQPASPTASEYEDEGEDDKPQPPRVIDVTPKILQNKQCETQGHTQQVVQDENEKFKLKKSSDETTPSEVNSTQEQAPSSETEEPDYVVLAVRSDVEEKPEQKEDKEAPERAQKSDEKENSKYRNSHCESVGTLKGLSSMASPRPKSPRPAVATPKKDEKEESFWEKIGTLGRKKRIKEVQEVQEEGKYAIDSPGNPTAPDLPPEEYALEENEERSMIEPRSFEDPKLKELIAVLIEWINDELADQRIIVKDIEEDLYDGQVLQKLLEKLSGEKLDVPEVTQSEEGQKQKLGIVLAATNRVLGLPRWSQQKWSVESIHSKNIVAILHLLVALARHFRAPVRLPENVAVHVVVVQKLDGSLSHRTVLEEITTTYDDLGMRCERDAFDTLFDHAPDKLQVVKKSLVTFVNKHLNKVNLDVTDLDTQFHDGVYLTLLMGLLEGFFVPLYSFHLTPQDFDQKVHNVAFAFELMQDVGLAKPKARPEDIVNLDLKSTLRVLYNLFTKYKNLS
ncbi:beta-parvin isoform X1 [Schistocerca americana]|uniref:beta-parvin isoform X1 n=1 Tax=Schistocerca americana TaxID=7009 RepID=UPI001F4FD1F9|nr:beta-parvin isoform X1 [Schistocerca americana]XP_047114169.1 beta-parvin isoform X1 [Schistocerca piceifrons]